MDLFPALNLVVDSLRKRGLKPSEHFPGYIQIEGCNFVYSPGRHHWLHKHTANHKATWSCLTDLQDAEQVADKIIEHISAMNQVD